MTFIIILISLVIERFFHWVHLRNWQWFYRFQNWLMALGIANWPSPVLLLICVLPWMIIAGVINYLLIGVFYGIFQIIFGVLVLLYCMGPENLWVQAFGCINDLHKEDPKLAVDRAEIAFGIPAPKNSQTFHQLLTKAIFIEANSRKFAVIFWFVILGPLGAVMYRSIALCAEQSELGLISLASTIQRWLDWIPVRIFTFLFALAGHFKDAFACWKQDVKTGVHGNDILLGECGLAAIEGKKTIHLPEDGAAEKDALELLDRVFVIVLVILAMLVLIVK